MRIINLAAVLLIITSAASAAEPAMPVKDAAYITCRQAQAMPPDQRKTLALDMLNRAAKYYNVAIYDSETIGEDLGYIIRAGCTIYPDQFLLPIISRAVRAAGGDPSMGTFLGSSR